MIQSKTVILSHPIRPSLSSGFVAARELAHRYGTVVRAFALRQLQTQQFDLQELRHETFLSCEAGSGTRTVADLMLRNHLFTPAGIVTLDSNESGKQAMMASMGISLVSLHTPRLELRTREIAIPSGERNAHRSDVAERPYERQAPVANLPCISPLSDRTYGPRANQGFRGSRKKARAMHVSPDAGALQNVFVTAHVGGARQTGPAVRGCVNGA